MGLQLGQVSVSTMGRLVEPRVDTWDESMVQGTALTIL